MLNKDKLLHFLAGMFIYAIGGLLLVAIVGYLKEVHDSYKEEHTADYNDFLATVLGGLFAESLTGGMNAWNSYIITYTY